MAAKELENEPLNSTEAFAIAKQIYEHGNGIQQVAFGRDGLSLCVQVDEQGAVKDGVTLFHNGQLVDPNDFPTTFLGFVKPATPTSPLATGDFLSSPPRASRLQD